MGELIELTTRAVLSSLKGPKRFFWKKLRTKTRAARLRLFVGERLCLAKATGRSYPQLPVNLIPRVFLRGGLP